MKFSILTALTFLTASVISAPPSSSPNSLSVRDDSPLADYSPLEKRKGGGGGKGGGGSSGGKGGGGSSGSGGRPISSYSFSPSSSTGGRTRDGSGPPPPYSGRYAGGAAVPFTAGGKSPSRGIAPYALPIAGLAIFPGIFLFGAVWAYGYPIGYNYYDGVRNHTSNVTCVCQKYQVCGCDPSDNSTVLHSIINNGTGGAPVNTSTIRTIMQDGEEKTYINGSLPNGTTASGGTDPSNAGEVSAATQLVMSYAGYWLMVVTVVAGVCMT